VKRRSIRRMKPLDLRRDAWIPGLRVGDPKASALAASLRLEVQRPCSACDEPTWLGQRDLVKYETGVPLLCAMCRRRVRQDAPLRALILSAFGCSRSRNLSRSTR